VFCAGFRPFVTDSDEPGWDHVVGGLVFPTLLLLRRSSRLSQAQSWSERDCFVRHRMILSSIRQLVQRCAVCGLRPIPKWHVAVLVPHSINTLNVLSLRGTSPNQLVSSGSRLKTVAYGRSDVLLVTRNCLYFVRSKLWYLLWILRLSYSLITCIS